MATPDGLSTVSARDDERGAEAALLSVVTDVQTTAGGTTRTAELGADGRGRGGQVGGADAGGSQRPPPSHRRQARRWRGERLLPQGLHVLAFVPLVGLVLILGVLVWKAVPAIRYNGTGFFTRSVWSLGNLYAPLVSGGGIKHPPEAVYGALSLIEGTLVSSAIALVLAVPVAVGTALIVVEKLPPRLSAGVGFCLEVLAGVPSVVFGLWGFFTLGPFLAHDVAPIWADHVFNHLPDVPPFRFFRGPTGGGVGLFTAGVVLAIMILPIIAATTRDLLRQVPRATVEGAVALGMTESEALGAVTIPWVRTGVIGASVLGLGRALGETIAVAMVGGALVGANIHSLYPSFGTIAATIVTTLESALTDVSGLATDTLAELALVLLVITLLANIGARLLVRRVATTALPVGRGI